MSQGSAIHIPVSSLLSASSCVEHTCAAAVTPWLQSLADDDSPTRSVSLCTTRRLHSFCVAQCILPSNVDANSHANSHAKNNVQKYVSSVYIVNVRYDVYANLEAEAAFLKLNDNGVHLLQLQAAFAKLQVCCFLSCSI